MANNYLITGYWGEPHVTPENQRGFNAAVFGAGRFVLPVGERLRAESIGNNTVRIYDGQLLDNGAQAGIPAGTNDDLLIPEAGQGMKRSDLIVFEYRKDPSTLVETGLFVVVQGTETTGTASDPALTQQDILTDLATIDQMPLWRINVNGAVINNPVQMFETASSVGGAEVLWVNTNHTSQFENQQLSVPNVGKYRTLIVEYAKTNSSSNDGKKLDIGSVVFSKANLEAGNYIPLESFYVQTGTYWLRRITNITSDALTFGSCAYYQLKVGGSTESSVANGMCVPLRILGMK